jgi:4-carboxymuconolactone decarboxylase
LFAGEITDSKADPELMNILQRLLYGEIFYVGDPDDKTRELITITLLTSDQTLPQLKGFTSTAMNIGITPVEIRETIYQTAPFIGFTKVLTAVEVINGVFKSRGISLLLEKKGTVGDNRRFEKGSAPQYPLYGDKMKVDMKDLPDCLGEAIPRIPTESRFGDFYTRRG